MISVSISNRITAVCPQLTLGLILCSVENSTFDAELWHEMNLIETNFRNHYALEQINKILAIQATRAAYKALGKDPNRYRPSAEALCRRIVRELPLYQINTLVDLINLISIQTGYSIGGFDAGKIEGDLLLTVGSADDLFEGIGRGMLNIEGLPVYKDALGGIGTPTSDHERTKLSLETSSLLMIINGYSGKEGLQDTMNLSIMLVKKYAHAQAIETKIL
jgi:DNA/RNA-binding domain of Phe-tRNA-synthetase-like protein